MAITINGNGTITGISTGGLPDGCVDTDMLANNAVTPAKSTISGGKVKQIVYAEMTSNFGMNSQNETDVGGMSAAIALTDASNDVLVELNFAPYVGGAGAVSYIFRVYRDSTELYRNGNGFYRTGDDLKATLSTIRFRDSGISDTNSHTYKLTAARDAGDDGFGINVAASGTYAIRNCITLTEVAS